VRTVIAMLEESPLDECVVRTAESLAGLRGRLLLIQAIPKHALLGGAHREAGVAEAHQYLHGLTRRMASVCHTSTNVFYGDGADAILEELFEHKADLVVMGVPAGHGFGDRPAGSVAAHVLACSPVPVCIARPADACFGARHVLVSARVLVPLDGSEFAEAALPEAAKLAVLLGGELVLLRVVPLLASLPPPGAAVWDVSALDRLEAEAWPYLRNVAAYCMREYACVCRVVVRVGVPADAILSSIGEERAGLLVMATHAHSSWQRFLLGSVTDRVLRKSPVPVVLIRPHAFQAPEPASNVQVRSVHSSNHEAAHSR
jgi:nucleotide-binding universal stress UspA family protein